MSRLPAVVSSARSAARTRRLLSGGSSVSQVWTCSEAKILMLEIQLLVSKLAGLGRAQNLHCRGVGEQIHSFHDGFIILDRQQNGHRLVPLGNQNPTGLPT